jgi:hypothetical protein
MNPWILGGCCFAAGLATATGVGYVGLKNGWFSVSKKTAAPLPK